MFGFIKRFIIKEDTPIIASTEPRMYLILREDLAYKYIQGAHALAEFSKHHNDAFVEWDNRHLICLSTFNGLSLREEYLKISNHNLESFCHYTNDGIFYATFYEPDLQSDLPTAIAIYEDGRGIAKDLLSHLKLATK